MNNGIKILLILLSTFIIASVIFVEHLTEEARVGLSIMSCCILYYGVYEKN